MKALTLYIDKWYIIGAVCTDGVPSLIKPKTGEECFWLYFYEDVANDVIVYGKDNKQHFHNKENHYYGDIFSLITDNKTSFIRYGRKQSIEKIFKASGIIDELKSAMGDSGGKIETYISFAKDISDASRFILKRDVLEPENFEIKESAARIDHLSLEYAFHHNLFSEEGIYLLLNACNENLIYSLYEYKDKLLLRKAENSLTGLGIDLRRRAMLEYVVKSINQRNNFLKSEKEYEEEYLRLSQYVDDWIVRLGNAKPRRPITIPNVSFARVGNTYQVTILKKDIDTRTSAVVDDIIREIVTYVRNTGVTNDKVHGVLFLGDTFSNSQFLSAIKEQYALPEEKYVHYNRTDLPNIVAVYTVIDCSQFSVATVVSEEQGEAEIERQKIAQEEEDRQKRAEEERIQQEKKDRAAREAVQRYEEAMRNVFDFEKKQDYAQMAEWADIALNHCSDDPEALKKKNDATRLLSEQKVREEQYRDIFARALESFKNGQWQDAKSQSDAALNLKPDSAEAKKIYNESEKKIKAAAEIEKYLTRADLFLAQKSYDEALRELKKVQSYDPENAEAAQRIKEIEDIRKEHTKKIASLVEKYEKAKSALNYDTAVEICEELIETDTLNQRKWSAETEKLKADRDKARETQKRFEDLKKKAMDADFREDWSSFINFATEAIAIHQNEDLSKRIERAKKKLDEQEKENGYQKEINRVNALLSSGNNDEASDILNRIQKIYPEHQREISELRKRVFASGDFWGTSTQIKKEQPKRPIGFRTPQEKTKPKADFFEEDTPQKKSSPATPKPVEPKTKPAKKTGIDFFDMDFKHNDIN